MVVALQEVIHRQTLDLVSIKAEVAVDVRHHTIETDLVGEETVAVTMVGMEVILVAVEMEATQVIAEMGVILEVVEMEAFLVMVDMQGVALLAV